MYNHYLYLGYWVVNSALLLIFNLLFPNNVVLGNFKFSALEGAIYAGFWMTFFIWAMWDVAIARAYKLRNMLTTFVFFTFVNSSAIWITARLPQYFGFGISAFYWAILLGIVSNIIHRYLYKKMTFFGKLKFT